jgi:hypothetical protein
MLLVPTGCACYMPTRSWPHTCWCLLHACSAAAAPGGTCCTHVAAFLTQGPPGVLAACSLRHNSQDAAATARHAMLQQPTSTTGRWLLQPTNWLQLA